METSPKHNWGIPSGKRTKKRTGDSQSLIGNVVDKPLAKLDDPPSK